MIYLQDEKDKHGADENADEFYGDYKGLAVHPVGQEEVLVQPILIMSIHAEVFVAVEVEDEGNKCRTKQQQHGGEEAHENPVIIQADAIVDPGAVVIEPLHAPVANAAVARTVRPHDFTVGAEKHWVKYFHHGHEVDVLRSFQVARVLAECDNVQEKCKGKKPKLQVYQV